MRRSLLSGAAAAVLLAGCTGADANTVRTAAATDPGTQYIIGIDISGSRTPAQLQEAQRLVGGIIERATFGDRLVLVETFRAGNDSAKQWEDSIPRLRTPGKVTGRERRLLTQFHEDVPTLATTFFDAKRSKQITSTDLLYTLGRAAEYAKAANGRRTTVVLLSDMLQSTPEMDMERAGGVPPASWLAERKAQRRLPDLSGVCVFVVGAEQGTARGAVVRNFWERYFAATGATFNVRNYRSLVSDAGELRCT